MSCSFQKRKRVCDQNRKSLKDWTMEQNDGFGLWIGGVAEKEDVSIGPQATDDFGTRRAVNGQALGADGDFAG
jgi:hypothetical protein